VGCANSFAAVFSLTRRTAEVSRTCCETTLVRQPTGAPPRVPWLTGSSWPPGNLGHLSRHGQDALKNVRAGQSGTGEHASSAGQPLEVLYQSNVFSALMSATAEGNKERGLRAFPVRALPSNGYLCLSGSDLSRLNAPVDGRTCSIATPPAARPAEFPFETLQQIGEGYLQMHGEVTQVNETIRQLGVTPSDAVCYRKQAVAVCHTGPQSLSTTVKSFTECHFHTLLLAVLIEKLVGILIPADTHADS
jgi:hypothetical protein